MRKFLISILLTLSLTQAHADIVVLVHGYLGTSISWTESGVLSRLQANDYRLAGNYVPGPHGARLLAVPSTGGRHLVYTVDLPSQAPLMLQADWLTNYLSDIERRHDGETITLVGHSAGGVVARLALVKRGAGHVTRLITIAAPHLGTGRALEALDATDDSGMFGWLKEWLVRNNTGNGLYNTLQASRGVLIDLAPPRPGNLLWWLNAQPHPQIAYVSIVRGAPYMLPGDELVPGFSQDLNQVPALAGKARSYTVAYGHLLGPQDGDILSRLLADATTR